MNRKKIKIQIYCRSMTPRTGQPHNYDIEVMTRSEFSIPGEHG